MSRLTLFLSILLGLVAASETRADDFNISLGGEYLSNLSKRGQILYDSYQVIPIYAVDFGSPDFVIVGSGIYFRNDWSDRLRYRSVLRFNATGDEPLYETGGVEASDHWDVTHEWDQALELGHPRWGEVSATISQDLKAHLGRYLQMGFRSILWPYPMPKGRVEVAVFGALGAGTASHNRYLYGDGAVSGLAHYEYGLSLALPPAIDRYFPVIQVKKFGLLGEDNRTAGFVSTKQGVQVVALFAFKVWSFGNGE